MCIRDSRYTVSVDQPVGIVDRFVLPTPQEQGCVVRSIDDLDGQLTATRVSVRCTERRKVVVAATMRETLLDVAAVEADREPAVVYLEPRGQGSEAMGRTPVSYTHLQPARLAGDRPPRFPSKTHRTAGASA